MRLHLEIEVQFQESVKRSDRHTGHLSMEKIGYCPKALYLELTDGLPPVYRVQATNFIRTCIESWVLNWIKSNAIKGIVTCDQFEQEVVASFDERFVGVIPARTIANEIVIVRGLNNRKFMNLLGSPQVPTITYLHVQSLMRHSHYRRSLLVFFNRDTMEFDVRSVSYNEAAAERLDQKAKDMLLNIKQKQMPQCLCGYCDKQKIVGDHLSQT